MRACTLNDDRVAPVDQYDDEADDERHYARKQLGQCRFGNRTQNRQQE